MMNTASAGRILVAAVTVIIVVVCAPALWVKLGVIRALLIISTFAGGFYLVATWVMVDRPVELKKKIPISGKELRRRQKIFYDWLASQASTRKR
jgi:hypothetical protein